jgi:hypothetical protein
MDKLAVGAIQGRDAVAVLERRQVLEVDPKSLFNLAGHASFSSAMTVSLVEARRMLPAAELMAISEQKEQLVLRVDEVETL